MTFIPTFYVFVIGLILGLLLFLTGKGHSLENKWVHLILGGIINIFRAIPFIILLTLLMPFTKAIMSTIVGPKGANSNIDHQRCTILRASGGYRVKMKSHQGSSRRQNRWGQTLVKLLQKC